MRVFFKGFLPETSKTSANVSSGNRAKDGNQNISLDIDFFFYFLSYSGFSVSCKLSITLKSFRLSNKF